MHMRILCTAVLFVLLAAGCGPRREASIDFGQGPVIIISIDTLRADRLGAWGYEAARTPNIDALAGEGVLFENAWSHVPLTLPAHASLFTGRLPWEHGVRNNIGYRFDPDRQPSIVAALRDAGYRTGGAVSAYVLRADTGISHGFDFYDDRIDSQGGQAQGRLSRSGSETAAIASRWIAEQNDEPFLFFLHLFEPHAPYEAPEPFRSSAASAYDAEVSAADAIVGEFIASLKQQGQYDGATIILVSDHGEGLNDHGEEEHGIFLYREAIHVPLIIKLPGGLRGGSRERHNVQLADIAPTIATLTGIDFPATGLSLVSDVPADRKIYAETFYPRIHLGWSELRSLVSNEHHYIEAPRPELYDLEKDPEEKQNVLSANRRVYASLRQELEGIDRSLAPPTTIDSEDAAKLAALGYIGTPRDRDSGELPDPKDGIGDIARMKRATAAAAEGNLPDAIASLRTIVEENPRFTDAWNLLGSLLEESGRPAEAVEAYKNAARAEPSLAPEFALSIASALFRLERFDEALEHAELARKTNPVGARLLEGRIHLARNNPSAAEAAAKTVMGSTTHSLQGSVLLAESLTAQGRFDEAMRTIESARLEAEQRRSAPVDAMNFVLGDLWARRGELEMAERYFQKEIAAFPRKRQTYANLALLYMAAGRTGDARRTVETMVRANPDPSTIEFAATTMATLGDDEAAASWRSKLP